VLEQEDEDEAVEQEFRRIKFGAKPYLDTFDDRSMGSDDLMF
jgi:hypothetical protein